MGKRLLTNPKDDVTRILQTWDECIGQNIPEAFKVAILELYFKLLKDLAGVDDVSNILARPILLNGQKKALTLKEWYDSVLNYKRVKDILIREVFPKKGNTNPVPVKHVLAPTLESFDRIQEIIDREKTILIKVLGQNNVMWDRLMQESSSFSK